MTSPGATERGRAWIRNFLPEDQPVARFLVDNVRFVSLSTVLAQSKAALDGLVASGKLDTPALLVPARSIEDIDGQRRPATPGSPIPAPIAYTSFRPAQRMPALPGSEAFIGNLIRDLAVLGPGRANWLTPEASLEQLRMARARSIVLVTDYSGSGRQLAEFAKVFVRNPTIRSWRSGRFIKIVAFAHAMSRDAELHLTVPGSAVDDLHHVTIAPSIATAGWTRSQRQQVEALCLRYARSKTQALGYRGSGGLYATSMSVPNNLPLILRQSFPGWSSLFDNRTVPSDLAAEIGEHAPRTRPEEVAERIGQHRLARSLTDYRRNENRELLLLLAALSRGTPTASQLAAQLGFERDRVYALTDALETFGLIDSCRRVTAAGDAALADARRAKRSTTVALDPADGGYYPSSLR